MTSELLNRRIAFVGLGNMGAPMSANLAARMTSPLAVSDADPGARARLSGGERVWHDSAAAAAEGCEIVILMLPNGMIVEEVLTGGVMAAMAEGGLVIDMSSAAPATYERLAEPLAARRLRIIDAPVSGGVPKAQTAELTIMAGGAAEDVAEARPVLESMGAQIFETGQLGSGQAVKALNNLLSAGTLALTIETLLLGKAWGLDPGRLNAILNVSTGRNNSTDKKVVQHILSRGFGSGFSLAFMDKDVRTAMALVEGAEAIAPLSAAATARLSEAVRALPSDADHTAIAQAIEAAAGITLD